MKHRSYSGGKIAGFSLPLISTLTAFGIIAVFLTGFAFLMTRVDVSDFVIDVMTAVALGTGAYAGGYICGKGRRKNGLLMGILCGFIIMFVISLMGVFLSEEKSGISVPVKLILCIVCAGIGGIVGVNSKSKR